MISIPIVFLFTYIGKKKLPQKNMKPKKQNKAKQKGERKTQLC